MRTTITAGPGDTIGVHDDWGYADGIEIAGRSGEVVIYVLTDAQLADFRVALDRVEASLEKRKADFDRDDETTGPEMAGFEAEVA